MQTLLAFIFVFGLIVLIHEFGHFYFAKKAGVLVREFAIGMGPKVFQTHRNETTYTIRALPIGGYVMMAGYEDDDDIRLGMPALLILDENECVSEIDLSKDSLHRNGVPVDVVAFDLSKDLYIEGQLSNDIADTVSYPVNENAIIIKEDGKKLQIAPENRQFQNAPLLQRMLTNIGGPLNNFLLSIVAFTLFAFMQNGIPANEPLIGEISPDSPAAESQLKTGDRVLSIDGEEINSWTELVLTVQDHPNETLEFEVESKDEEKYIEEITPMSLKTDDGQEIGQLGVTVYMKNSFTDKLFYGFTETWNVTVMIATAIVSLFTGSFSVNDLGGPVAIFNLTGEVASAAGFLGIINFIGLLSINLGLMNLLPIPGLDGGKLILNVLEGVRGKALEEDTELKITLVGAILLVALMLFVTWNDIQRFFFN